jgi:hypothetical protein
MQGVGRELRGVPLGRREPADCLVDGVYIDQSSLENRRAIDQFGDSSSGCASGTTSLGVKGHRMNAPILHKERNARQIPTSSPTSSTREGTVSSRPQPALITQVVLKKLPLHAMKGKALCP